ncbi:tetratricopeptide repeat protein [Aeromicrobium sp. CnD17-E]|uniref:tetratricopeptide repeat protein n=1 Tax=Aeromicrobium sp. CnD17-E TaxID=2954487 RepID=UPI0020977768|nr:tetratricopeptide repeat protein [Aeromicrobium sp. CnD17-E]MCO7238545.1 tetratricopeptide repeat protein [Aeromicrobium sp. CnD17-E]
MDDERTLALAWHWLQTDRPDRCLEVLDGADPTDPQVRLLRAWALSGLERWADAEAAARSGLADDPGSVELRRVLAHALTGSGRLKEAAEVLASTVADAPEDVDVRAQLAANLVARRLREESQRAVEALAALEPGSARVARLRAHWHLEFGRREDARRHVLEALEVDPADPQARAMLGELTARSGDVAGVGHLRRAALDDFGDRSTVARARQAGVLDRYPGRLLLPALRVHPGWAAAGCFVLLWVSARVFVVGDAVVGGAMLAVTLLLVGWLAVAHAVAVWVLD